MNPRSATHTFIGCCSAHYFVRLQEEVLQYFRMNAERGDVQSQITLGQYLLTGAEGIEQNFEDARHFLEMARN